MKKLTKLAIFSIFANSFIYGSIYLLIGYTQTGIESILFANPEANAGIMLYLLLGQSFGLIIGTFIISKIMHKVNVRWLYTIGFAISCGILLLIAFLNQIVPDYAANKYAIRIVLFVSLTLLMGIFISPSTPISSTLFGTVYTGRDKIKMVSSVSGLFCIGSGFLPIIASPFILKVSSNHNFDEVKIFYLIAACLALLGALLGYTINYQFNRQSTTSKLIEKHDTKDSFNIWPGLIQSISMMVCFMIFEISIFYVFVKMAQFYQTIGIGTLSAKNKIWINQSFGLCMVLQGFMRIVFGIWVIPKIKIWIYLLCSSLLTMTGFILIISGLFGYEWGTFLIATLIGLGLGAMFPSIVSYAIDLDPKRAPFISMRIMIAVMTTIPLTEVIAASLWTKVTTTKHLSNSMLYSLVIMCLVAASLLVVLLISYTIYLSKLQALRKAINT